MGRSERMDPLMGGRLCSKLLVEMVHCHVAGWSICLLVLQYPFQSAVLCCTALTCTVPFQSQTVLISTERELSVNRSDPNCNS